MYCTDPIRVEANGDRLTMTACCYRCQYSVTIDFLDYLSLDYVQSDHDARRAVVVFVPRQRAPS